MTDVLSVIIFGSQHVKSASQGQSRRASARLAFSYIFTEPDQNYFPWKHGKIERGKFNFLPTVMMLS